jgi:hypothetical protein
LRRRGACRADADSCGRGPYGEFAPRFFPFNVCFSFGCIICEATIPVSPRRHIFYYESPNSPWQRRHCLYWDRYNVKWGQCLRTATIARDAVLSGFLRVAAPTGALSKRPVRDHANCTCINPPRCLYYNSNQFLFVSFDLLPWSLIITASFMALHRLWCSFGLFSIALARICDRGLARNSCFHCFPLTFREIIVFRCFLTLPSSSASFASVFLVWRYQRLGFHIFPSFGICSHQVCRVLFNFP